MSVVDNGTVIYQESLRRLIASRPRDETAKWRKAALSIAVVRFQRMQVPNRAVPMLTFPHLALTSPTLRIGQRTQSLTRFSAPFSLPPLLSAQR